MNSICGYIYDIYDKTYLELVKVQKILSYQREWEKIYSGMSARFECICSTPINYNNLFKKYKNEGFLIKDDVFLDIMKENCIFITDGNNVQFDTMTIINNIKAIDQNSSIYFYSNGINKINETICFLSNVLYICSDLPTEVLLSCIGSNELKSIYNITVLNEDTSNIKTCLEYVIIGKGIIDSYDNYFESTARINTKIFQFEKKYV